MPGYASKPILSKGGSRLQAYAAEIGAPPFWCYPHLFERRGSRTFVSRIAHQLLFAGTREEYISRLPQAYSDRNAFIHHGLVTQAAFDKFVALFGLCPEHPLDDLLQAFDPQGLWTRSRYDVSTCSDHAERLHSELNAAVKGHRTLAGRLGTIHDRLKERFTSAGEFRDPQPKETRKRLSQSEGEKTPPCVRGSDGTGFLRRG
jgi:hypothetical protein